MGAGAILAAVLILGGAVGGYAALETGYMPIKDIAGFSTLEVIPPAGNYTTITMGNIVEMYPKTMDILYEIPHLNDIRYQIYLTNASLDDVADQYNRQLSAKGYSCLYSGKVDVGNVTEGIIPLYYYGYTKGITAVGVVMTDYLPTNNAILYTTGHADYYRDIIPWLEEKKAEYGV